MSLPERCKNCNLVSQGPAVQSMVSLASLLSGQQKLLTVFQQKIEAYIRYFNIGTLNENLTKDIVCFEQPSPDLHFGIVLNPKKI